MNYLSFSSLATEHDLRQAIIQTGDILYERGLLTSNNGNISVRMGDDALVITPSTLCKGRMDYDDLLVVDLAGNVLKSDPKRKRRISSETPMHLEAYRQRPDIRAVIHAHPAHAVALTIANIPFPVDVMPEVLEGLGPVPTTDFATPSTSENADAIRELIRDHDALLIRNHGSLTVGRDLEEALNHLERVESVAKTYLMARSLGAVNTIPPEMIEKLHGLNKVMRGK